MLSRTYICQNPQIIKQACIAKGVDPKLVDQFIKLDETRLNLLEKIQTLREKRNKINSILSTKPDKITIAKGKKLKKQIQDLESKLAEVIQNRQKTWFMIPNVPSEDSPQGSEENDKLIISKWGEISSNNIEAKNHLELGQKFDLFDLEKGSDVAGFRGYYLKNDLVLLEQALLNFVLKKLIAKDFIPFRPPVILKKQAFINTGHFPWGEQEAYQLTNDEGYIAGTSEVGMISYHQNQILKAEELPLRYAAISPCYRREIGSYGKDTKGLYRVHEFMKVEQVVFCQADEEESQKEFEMLLKNSEEILQELELPYRVCQMPRGDMGEPQYRKYDIEVWMPGRNAYGETMSCSAMLDFQSRRANIKYKTKNNDKKFVYTLNNTAIATPRILIPLLEINRQEDGSIKIPECLQDFMGKTKITHPLIP